jgi:hypothetical protein
VIPTMLDNTTQGELTMYENNYKTLNLITTALGRNVYNSLTSRNYSRCLVEIMQSLLEL